MAATRRAFLRLVLAVLLLVAQQAAVTHAIWHAHDGLAGHARAGYVPGDDQHSSQNQLCEFHAALGQVLGGAQGPAWVFCALDLASDHAALTARPYQGAPALSFYSRAPPSLL